MSKKMEIGKMAEDMACRYLSDDGYEILERNYRFKRAEVDIIARHEKIYVFLEVKARSRFDYGRPEEAVGDKKQRLMAAVANHYVIHKNHVGDIRFDIVAIDLRDGQNPQIEHFVDAFFPTYF